MESINKSWFYTKIYLKSVCFCFLCKHLDASQIFREGQNDSLSLPFLFFHSVFFWWELSWKISLLLFFLMFGMFRFGMFWVLTDSLMLRNHCTCTHIKLQLPYSHPGTITSCVCSCKYVSTHFYIRKEIGHILNLFLEMMNNKEQLC